MIIRPETTADLDGIRRVEIDAFANHPVSRQTEHLIVDALRDAGALTISLVAEDEGDIVGHVAFSPILIDGAEGRWFTLGPVGVLPARQRQGIGSKLIEAGLDALRRLGAEGCVLVGPPDYYRRFGFRTTDSLIFPNIPPEYFLILPLSGAVPRGEIAIHPAFFVEPK